MNSIRALQRLIERIEEFLEDYKSDLEADEVVTIEDTITIIDRLQTDLQSQEDEEELDED